MTMNARWRLRPDDPTKALELSRRSGLCPLVAQLLLNRGIDDPGRATAFLDARMGSLYDPELLPGAVEAAERIVEAVRSGRRIIVYGDYDVNGVCGTSILWTCLKLAGAREPGYYIPHRVEEGYGVNAEALRRLAGENPSALIVTVNCGISAFREAELARELGVELIVTDHHTIGAGLPEAAVVVHPRRPDGHYPSGDLCGAGVAFKLAWQVCKTFGDGKRASPHLREFLVRSMGLVALATIADVVPLSDENRVLVRHGLGGIVKEPTTGLRALMEVSGCAARKRLNTGTVGFILAPRINAAGRLERAMMAVEMLTTDDAMRAQQIALELDRCNARRQEIERKMNEEARAMIEAAGGVADRRSIVLASPGWHPGVIGIVAGRLAELYHRPTIILAQGDHVAQGSARSIAGFDLYAALKDCAAPLLGFGGHAAAAGLKLAKDDVAVFAQLFEERCRDGLTPEHLERVMTIDAEVHLGTLSLRVVEEMDRLEPYGIGNPKPLLLAGHLEIVGQPRIVGEQRNHLQLRVRQGDVIMKAIGWNMAERGKALAPGTPCSLVFHPSINEWNNHREVQLEIKDFAIDAAGGSPGRQATATAIPTI